VLIVRALIVLLLLANIAFLAWSRWIAEPLRSPVTPAVNAPRLVLASEAPAAAAPQAVVLDPDTRCVSVGPFLDLTEAARASTRLRELGFEPRQRVSEGTVWSGYWVALERLEGREAAEEVVERLRRFGVTDAYIMPGSEDGVTVSLGLFSERQRALRRLDEVRALGYAPAVAERQRTGNVYWIDVSILSAAELPDPGGFEGERGRITRLEIRPCDADGEASEAVPMNAVPDGVPG
jgi:hypothetical protein